MITIYLVIKSQIPELYAHFKLADMFATSPIKQSKLGYCSLNLASCIEQVCLMEEDELLPPGCASDQIGNFVDNLGEGFMRTLTFRTPIEA